MAKCRIALPSPEAAGFTTKERLLQAAKAYPHLRPCPRHKGAQGTWNWVSITLCEKCSLRLDVSAP